MMMWQIVFLRNKPRYLQTKSLDQGFMTLEMIIASWVGFFFLVFSMQTIVSGLAFKVISQKEFGGDRLIQEEIERLNDLARVENLSLIDPALADPDVNRIAACDGTWDSGDGTANDGHGQALWNARVVEGDTLTASTATTITIDPNTATDNIVGLTLTLVGTRNLADPGGAGAANAHKILGINYVVTAPDELGNPETIAERYVEVIPDEALECP